MNFDFSTCRICNRLVLAILFSQFAIQSNAEVPKAVTLQRLSLPRGPGSIEGLGESFTPDLATGSARYSVNLTVPAAAGNQSPKLMLNYDSNFGIGPFGVGWILAIDTIQRQTDKGIPTYSNADTFVSGNEELVAVSGDYCFAENATDYARFRPVGDGWQKTLTSGINLYFGETEQSREGRPGKSGFNDTFRWLLSSSIDLHGNRIDYEYSTFAESAGIKYLSRIRYGYQGTAPSNYHEITFSYELAPVSSISFCSTFNRTTKHRCSKIQVNTSVAETTVCVRKYSLVYDLNSRVSLLKSITQSDAKDNELPPARFAYTDATLLKGAPLQVVNANLPRGLKSEDLAICDLNHDGLADICISIPDQHWEHLINNGNFDFGKRRAFDVPSTLSLRDPRTQLIDITGDGVIDLVTATPAEAGQLRVSYFSIDTPAENPSAPRLPAIGTERHFKNTCKLDLTTNGIRLFDVNFDKSIDLTRIIDDSLIVAINRPAADGGREWIESRVFFSESSFPFDTVSTTMQMTDVNGDRLMDFVDVFERDGYARLVSYYGIGDGHFSEGRTLRFNRRDAESEFAEHKTSNLQSFHFADVNSDGLSDLIHVIPGNVRVWTSRGELFDEPVDFPAPSFRSSTQIHFVDLNGNGSTDVVWVDPSADTQVYVLDCFPPGRGNLLSEVTNGIGKKITIEYKPINDYYLASLKQNVPWMSHCPIPLHVVSEMTLSNSLDLDGDKKIDTEKASFIYADPFYDGIEKQFRGFSYVTQIQWGTPAGSDTPGTETVLKRFRFHTGAPEKSNPAGFNEIAGYEEEPLKGRLHWEEISRETAVAIDENRMSFRINDADRGNLDGFDNDGDGTVDEEDEMLFIHNRKVYRRDINYWNVRELYTNSSSPKLFPHNTVQPKRLVRDAVRCKALVYHVEGPGVDSLPQNDRTHFPPCVTKEAFEYDAFGQVVERIEFGIVSPESRKDRQRIRRYEFAVDGDAIDRWILDRVSISMVCDAEGRVCAAERNFFGDDSGQFELKPLYTLGRRAMLIRKEAILIDDSTKGIATDELKTYQWVQRSVQSYDRFGNPIWLLDGEGKPENPAAGNSREFRYDPVFHTFPISESICVSQNVRLNAKASYDLSFGLITACLDFSETASEKIQESLAGASIGEVRSEKGNLTKLKYDSHGRLVAMISPGDTDDFPTEVYSYVTIEPHAGVVYQYDSQGNRVYEVGNPTNKWPRLLGEGNGTIDLGIGLSHVLTQRREISGKQGTIASASLFDGLGRVVGKLEESDILGRPIVKELMAFDSRGQTFRLSQPTELGGELAASRSWQHTLQFRDPLCRVARTLNPPETDGDTNAPGKWSERRTLYLPLSERVFDEEDCRIGGQYEGTFKEIRKDGFNRIIDFSDHVRLTDDGEHKLDFSEWRTSYKHDVLDNVVMIADAARNFWTATYDSLRRRSGIKDPDRGNWIFKYDKADNLVSRVDSEKQIIVNAFDGANRLRSETAGHGEIQTVTYHYDLSDDRPDRIPFDHTNVAGQLSWVRDSSGEEHFAYDERHRCIRRLKRIRNPANKLSRDFRFESKFDGANREIEVAYQDGTCITRTYGPRGLVNEIKSGATTIASGLSYEPSGKLRSQIHGNGVHSRYFYDPRLRLSKMQVDSPDGGVLLDYSYEFDAASNLARINDNRPDAAFALEPRRFNQQVFEYDDLYRLVKAHYPAYKRETPSQWISYRFSMAGATAKQLSNLLDHNFGACESGLGNKPDGTTVNPHLLTRTGVFVSKADANGCRIGNGKHVVEYDAWHKAIRTVFANGKFASHLYDYRGERVASASNGDGATATYFPDSSVIESPVSSYLVVHQSDNIVAIRTVLGTGQQPSWAFINSDHVGSPSMLLDSDGKIIEERTYTPFGAIRAEFLAANRRILIHGFAGGLVDTDTDYTLLGQRYLDSRCGQFISPDPVLFADSSGSATASTHMDPYAYSARSPLVWVDRDGRLLKEIAAVGLVATRVAPVIERVDWRASAAATAAIFASVVDRLANHSISQVETGQRTNRDSCISRAFHVSTTGTLDITLPSAARPNFAKPGGYPMAQGDFWRIADSPNAGPVELVSQFGAKYSHTFNLEVVCKDGQRAMLRPQSGTDQVRIPNVGTVSRPPTLELSGPVSAAIRYYDSK